MQTRELVSWIIEDFAPGYSRPKVLSYIRRAQNEVFNFDCAHTLFINKSDPAFPIPLLSTAEGVLSYTPSALNLVDSAGDPIALEVNGHPVNVRRIKRVFTQLQPNSPFNASKFYGSTFSWAGVDEGYARRITKAMFRAVPAIMTEEVDSEDAKVTFLEDPGTTTGTYYIEFYFGPIDLTSETVPMSIDSNKWAEAIFKAVRGYIEESRNGRTDLLDGPRQSYSFRGYWIPKIRSSFNAGIEQRRPYQFRSREFG